MSERILICDGCGRLWIDDDDSDSESCETPGCGRFKQRMEWATAQQIEDRDTNLLAELTALRAENERLRVDAERYRWLWSMIFDDSIIVARDRMLHGDELDTAIDAAMKIERT